MGKCVKIKHISSMLLGSKSSSEVDMLSSKVYLCIADIQQHDTSKILLSYGRLAFITLSVLCHLPLHTSPRSFARQLYRSSTS